MKRTVKRNPIEVPIRRNNDEFFNHADWKGFTDNKNFVKNDQQQFIDCDNIYVDTNELLSSRPAIRKSDAFFKDIPESWDIETTWNKPTVRLIRVGSTIFHDNLCFADIRFDQGIQAKTRLSVTAFSNSDSPTENNNLGIIGYLEVGAIVITPNNSNPYVLNQVIENSGESADGGVYLGWEQQVGTTNRISHVMITPEYDNTYTYWGDNLYRDGYHKGSSSPKEIHNIWQFNDVTVIHYDKISVKFINKNGTVSDGHEIGMRIITKPPREEERDDTPVAIIKPIRVEDKIFIFVFDRLSVYKITENKFIENATDYIYVPTTIINDNENDTTREDENILTTSKRQLWTLNPTTDIDFSQLDGKRISVKVGKEEFIIDSWSLDNEKILVDRLNDMPSKIHKIGRVVTDSVVSLTGQSTPVSIRYQDARQSPKIDSRVLFHDGVSKVIQTVSAGRAVDLNDKIMVSFDDISFVALPNLPDKGPSLVINVLNTTPVYLPAARYGNPWLSDDGLCAFAITNFGLYRCMLANTTADAFLTSFAWELIYTIPTSTSYQFNDGIVPSGHAIDTSNWCFLYERATTDVMNYARFVPILVAGWDVKGNGGPNANMTPNKGVSAYTLDGSGYASSDSSPYLAYIQGIEEALRKYDSIESAIAAHAAYMGPRVVLYYLQRKALSWCNLKMFWQNPSSASFYSRPYISLMAGTWHAPEHEIWKSGIDDYKYGSPLRIVLLECVTNLQTNSGPAIYEVAGTSQYTMSTGMPLWPNTEMDVTSNIPTIPASNCAVWLKSAGLTGASQNMLTWKVRIAWASQWFVSNIDSLCSFEFSISGYTSGNMTNMKITFTGQSDWKGNLLPFPKVSSSKFLISKDGARILSDLYLVKWETGDTKYDYLLDLRIEGDKRFDDMIVPITVLDDGTIVYSCGRIIYTSNRNTIYGELSTIIPGGIFDYIIPEYFENLDEWFLSVGDKLYITDTRYNNGAEFLWYIPKRNVQKFEGKITNMQIVSKEELAIYCEYELWIVTTTEFMEASAYTYNKSKVPFGCRDGDDVIISLDGKQIIWPTSRGIAAMTYQEFTATTEQALAYLTDTIQSTYTNWFENKLPVKCVVWKYWLFYYQVNSNNILMLDMRSATWYKWSYKSPIRKMIVIDDRLIFLCDEIFVLTEDGEYSDDGEMIKWFIESQKLHFNAINNYKIISQFIFNGTGNYEQTAKLQLRYYDKVIRSVPSKVFENKINDIRTYVHHIFLPKLSELQYRLSVDEYNTEQHPLKLAAITIKYKTGEMVR